MGTRRLVRIAVYREYLTVVGGALLEVVVRVSGFAEPQLYDPIYVRFDGSPDNPYVHRPNFGVSA
jgi:hypothetical protein